MVKKRLWLVYQRTPRYLRGLKSKFELFKDWASPAKYFRAGNRIYVNDGKEWIVFKKFKNSTKAKKFFDKFCFDGKLLPLGEYDLKLHV